VHTESVTEAMMHNDSISPFRAASLAFQTNASGSAEWFHSTDSMNHTEESMTLTDRSVSSKTLCERDYSRRVAARSNSSAALWAEARDACHRRPGNMTLCAAEAFCPGGLQSRFTRYLQSTYWLPRVKAQKRDSNTGLWVPVQGASGEAWLKLTTVRPNLPLKACWHAGELPSNALRLLTNAPPTGMTVGCCQQTQ